MHACQYSVPCARTNPPADNVRGPKNRVPRVKDLEYNVRGVLYNLRSDVSRLARLRGKAISYLVDVKDAPGGSADSYRRQWLPSLSQLLRRTEHRTTKRNADSVALHSDCTPLRYPYQPDEVGGKAGS